MNRFDPRARLSAGLFGASVSGWWHPSVIKSIQYAPVTFAGADVTKDATIIAVVLANTFVLHLGQAESVPQGVTTCVLNSTTTVRFTKSAAGGAGTHQSVVVEFQPGILRSNQDFSMSTAGTTTTATLPIAVAVAKAFVIPRGTTFNNAALDFYDIFGSLTLTNPTTVTYLRYNPVGSVTPAGTVIEFR